MPCHTHRLSPRVPIHQVIVGSMYWDLNLPWAMEAFVYADDKDRDKIAAAHRAFLEWHGLTSEEVPLLQYRCAESPLNPAAQPTGECFRDVSEA